MRKSSFTGCIFLFFALFLIVSCGNEESVFSDSDVIEILSENNEPYGKKSDTGIDLEGPEKIYGSTVSFERDQLSFQDSTSSNSTLIVTSASRAFYKFENNLNDIVNSHTGTATGSVSYVTGAVGKAISLNNSWVTIPNSTDFNFERTDVLCFDFWVKRIVAKGEENIISRMQHADGNPLSKDMRGWKIYYEDNGKVTLLMTHSWDSVDHKNTLKVQTISRFSKKNKWYHIELSYDGTSLASGVQIKVDGEVQNLNAIHNDLTGSIMTDAPLIIGGPNNLSESFTGLIDELEINIKCYSNPCDTVVCGNNSHCEIVNSSAACICNPDYTEEILDGSCINSKQAVCIDAAPANATSVVAPVTITYTTAGGWSQPSACSWNCNTDYILENGSCINSKQVNCTDSAPVNATSNIVPVTITYTTAGGWSTPSACSWNCNNNYILENGSCINSKQVNCTDSAPVNATSNVVPVTITYTTANGWSTPSTCSWNCNNNFILDNGICINSKQVNCADSAPANATSNIVPVTIIYTTASGWSQPSICSWNCNEGYISENGLCIQEIDESCENIACSGHGTCSPSNFLKLRTGHSGVDTLRGMSLLDSGSVAYGGFTDGIITGTQISNKYKQLVAGITDSSFNHFFFIQNSDNSDSEIKHVAAGQGLFAVLIQNGNDGQKIVAVSDAGVPQSELDLSVPYGIEVFEITASGNYIIAGSSGSSNAVVSEITNTGTVIWTQELTSDQWLAVKSVDISDTGNIAVTGTTDGTVFGISGGNRDVFTAVFDSTGSFLWGVQTGTAGNDQDPVLRYDNYGNLIVTFITDGNFYGTGAGFMDAALVKYSGSDGTELWRRQFGTPAVDAPFSVAVSPEDQIFVAGATLGSIDGKINEGTGLYGMNTADVFITEFNGSGTKYASVTYGDALHDWLPEEIEAAGDGIVYIGGNTGRLDFEAGVLFSDMFMLKTDMTGGTSFPECVCDQGYVNINNECVEEESCENVSCGINGTCSVINYKAVCVCDEGYEFDGLSCVEIFDPCDGETCSGHGQCNSEGLLPDCECESGYTNDGNPLQCINEKTVQCKAEYLPPNSSAVITYETVYFINNSWWTNPSFCEWTCDYGYDRDGWSCISSKTVQCNATEHQNADISLVDVQIFYDPQTGWSQPAECEWSCRWNTISEDGVNCIYEKIVECVDVSPDNGHKTSDYGTVYYYSSMEGWTTAYCPWECDQDYDQDYGICRNVQYVQCPDLLPEHAVYIRPYAEITYTDAEGWSSPQSCGFECVYGYISEDGMTCINSKVIPCVESQGAHTVSTQIPVTVWYDPETGWEQPALCSWSCEQNYISEDGVSCINQKNVLCAEPPAHATAPLMYDVTIHYTIADGWSLPERCDWACDLNYTQSGDICIADTRIAPCQNAKPENSVWTGSNNGGQIWQTWNGEAWMPSANECSWTCIADYISEDGSTCIHQKYEACAEPPLNASALSRDDVPVTYSDIAGWSMPAMCPWACNVNYSPVGDTCVADTRTVACQNTKPDITVWKASNPDGNVFQTWSGTEWLPSEYACEWGCETGYYYNDECVDGLPPFEPSGQYPADGADNIPYGVETTLLWEGGDPYGEAVTYEVKFDTVLPPKKVICRNIAAESCSAGYLLHSKDYFWQVTAKNAGGKFIRGPIWRFRTAVNANDPVPVWPGDSYITADRIGSAGVELRWNAASDNIGVRKYIIYADGIPLKTVMNPGLSVTIIPLLPETVYSMKIEACDDSRCTENGPAVSFETSAIENTERQEETLDASNFIRVIDRYRSVYRETAETQPVQHFVKTTAGNDYSPIYIDQASVVNGEVKNEAGEYFSNALIYVKDHPEFGYTYTGSGKDAGKWTMVVNGGPAYVFVIGSEGYLSVQRAVKTESEMIQTVNTAVLIEESPAMGTVNLMSGESQYVESPSHNDDGRGARQAAVVINPGTEAFAVNKDGTFEVLDSITIHQTEYTKGINGREAMPAPLPKNIAYTYCSEMTVAEAPDAKSIVFSKPVYYYLDNFLNFPVGTAIPNGSFDRESSMWTAENDGVVIAIVSIKTRAGGTQIAEIDIDGDNVPEPAGVLFNQIEITDDELQLLAEKYGAAVANGVKTLWRVPVAHFSPVDFNLRAGITENAIEPVMTAGSEGSDPNAINCPSSTNGSIVECESRILGERIDIPGTDFSLHYRSDGSGRQADKKLKIIVGNAGQYSTISGVSPVIEIKMIDAGEITTPSWTSITEAEAVWDGKDARGVEHNGFKNAKVTVRYLYPSFYQCEGYTKGATTFSTSGTLSGDGGIPGGDDGSSGFIVSQKPCGFAGMQSLNAASIVKLYNHATKPSGLGGLTLDVNSKYDLQNKRLYRGDGIVTRSEYLDNIVTTLKQVPYPRHIKTLPDGSYVFVESDYRITKLTPSGELIPLAGGGAQPYKDGMSPLDASIYVTHLAVDRSGRIYFTDEINHRVLKIDLDGLLYIAAGNGSAGSWSQIEGDNGPAVNAPLSDVGPVTVASDGTVYFASNYTIRKITGDGIITSLFPWNFDLTGGSHLQIRTDLEITGDDKVLLFSGTSSYMYSINRVGKINLTGTPVITSLFSNQSDPGVHISFYDIYPVGTETDVKFYFANETGIELYDNGIRSDVIGNGIGYGGDNGLAKDAVFNNYLHFTFSNQGELIIADFQNSRIRKVGPQSGPQTIGGYMIPDRNTGALLGFDHYGSHLKTIDSVTRTEIYNFEYEQAVVPGAGNGLEDYVGTVLKKIIDADGRETVFDRSDTGRVRIISPDGSESYIILNQNGMASEFVQPDGSSYLFSYKATADGTLLNKITYPNGRYTDYTYDEEGRLEKIIDQKTDETVPYKELSSIVTLDKFEKKTMLETAEGRETQYRYRADTMFIDRTITQPDGTGTVLSNTLNWGKTVKTDNGGEIVTTTYETKDPRFGYHMPYVYSQTVQTGGLTMSVSKTKAAALANPIDLLSHTTLTDTTNINGKVWASAYNTAENSSTLTTPMSRVSKRYLDAKGRTTSVVNPDVNNVNFSYRSDGRIETVSQGSGYDERLLSVSYYSYTDETTGALKGEIATVVDPEMHTVDFEYDLMGRITKKIFEKNSADERIVEYVFDESGNVLAITPAGRPAHNFYYDSVDLPEAYDAPAAGMLTPSELRTQYFYNLDRQLESILRPDGTSIYLTYELTKEGYATSTGKLQKITVPGRGDINLTYKATGGKRLDTVTTPEGNILSYTYNGALMASESWSGAVTGTVSRTYNNDFRTTAVTTGGISAGYTYDNDGLLLSAGDMTITRDTESGMITGTALDSITTTQSYNSFGEISIYDAGDFSYAVTARDKLGRITEKTETVEGTFTKYNYEYDTAGRLAKVWENELLVSEYTYDDNGNRTSKNGIAFSYDDQDRLTGGAYSSYTYTANGDVLTKTNVFGTTTYTHDALGNLTEVILPNNDEISYIYDGRNRRIAKMINGAVTERFIYQNQLKPSAKVDANGNILEQYIYGTRINTPDYIIKNGEQYRVVSDERGSVRMVVKVSDGTVSQRIDYNEFGIVIADSNPGFQPFYYAGGVYDLDTQLVKFGARDYDPATGRWLQKEPLGFAGSDNFYSYCDGDPVNFVDPNGLEKQRCFDDEYTAIIEASKEIHDLVEQTKWEWSALIYDDYSSGAVCYTNPGTNFSDKNAPFQPFSGMTSGVHGHVYGEAMSDGRNPVFNDDRNLADKYGINMFMVTPNGDVDWYAPNSGAGNTTEGWRNIYDN